jgi:hypothetical protein
LKSPLVSVTMKIKVGSGSDAYQNCDIASFEGFWRLEIDNVLGLCRNNSIYVDIVQFFMLLMNRR